MNDGDGIVRTDGFVEYPERRVKLGTVAVNSGCLLLADPTYIRNCGGVDDLDDAPRGDDHARPVLEGLGLLFTAGFGDGVYDVFATVGTVPGWGERVKRVEVILITEGTAQARADRDVDIAVSLMRGRYADGDRVPGEELFEQARAAESDAGRMGSALTHFRPDPGWTRADLAGWLGIGEAALAALCCEPRPVPAVTAGPEGARGVFTAEGGIFILADRYGADGGRLLRAFREGRDVLDRWAPGHAVFEGP
jgi:hypothetical protein